MSMALNETLTKICTRCGEEKPATNEFYKNKKNGKYGLYSICKECERKYFKDYYKNNKESYVERYKENQEHYIEYRKQWFKNNPERMKASARKRRLNKKEDILLSFHKYRAKVHKVKGVFTLDDWKSCKDYFNNECAYCGEKENLSPDHVIPFSKKGKHTKSNIVCSCRHCNFSKQDSDFRVWYSKQHYFSEERLKRIESYMSQS